MNERASWLRLLSRGRTTPRQGALSRRPELEQLESRTVLSAARASIATALTHSIENYTNIVTATYQRYLGRGPDGSGLAFWVGQMDRGTITDEMLEANFLGSPEYIRNHGGTGPAWVEGMYMDLLGRLPDAGGLRFWVEGLQNGMKPEWVALGFARSAEREAQHVTSLYEEYLGRTPDEGGLRFWVDQYINNGQTNEKLAAGFLGSDEYYAKNGNNQPDQWLQSAVSQVFERAATSADFRRWLPDEIRPGFGSVSSSANVMLVPNPLSSGNGELTESHPEVPGQGDGQFGASRADRERAHAGLDLKAPVGTSVMAVANGKVVHSRNDWRPGDPQAGGNVVVVEHVDAATDVKHYTRYMLLNGNSQPQVGDRVTQGQVIGQVGRTGDLPPGGDSYLHFEIRRGAPDGIPIAPVLNLDPGGDLVGGQRFASGDSANSDGEGSFAPLSLALNLEEWDSGDNWNAPEDWDSGDDWAVPEGWDVIGGYPSDPADSILPDGWDSIGGDPFDPYGSYIPPGWDFVGGELVDPTGSVIPEGWDFIGGQAYDPVGSYIPEGWDVVGGEPVNPGSTPTYSVYFDEDAPGKESHRSRA